MKRDGRPVRTCVRALLVLLTLTAPLAAREGPQLPMTEGRVAADRAEVYYRLGGSGPSILLIHGFTVTGDFWDPFLDAFGAGNSVIVPELRGHGRSTNSAGAFTFRDSARDMFAIMDRLGVDRILGVGHSAGAITLLHMAILNPSRVEAMVLVGGGHRVPIAGRKLLRDYPDLDSLSAQWQTYLRRAHPGGDAQIRALHAQLRALAENYDDFEFSPERLATVRARTLIAWGDRDELTPLEIPIEMYRSIPDARLWVLPGQGHMPFWREWGGSAEAAQSFPAVVRQFFAGH